jgi:hypothetical protein
MRMTLQMLFMLIQDNFIYKKQRRQIYHEMINPISQVDKSVVA